MYEPPHGICWQLALHVFCLGRKRQKQQVCFVKICRFIIGNINLPILAVESYKWLNIYITLILLVIFFEEIILKFVFVKLRIIDKYIIYVK